MLKTISLVTLIHLLFVSFSFAQLKLDKEESLKILRPITNLVWDDITLQDCCCTLTQSLWNISTNRFFVQSDASFNLFTSGQLTLTDKANRGTVILKPQDASNQIGGEIRLKAGEQLHTTIEIDGNWQGSGKGRIITDELQLEGGSGIAEEFTLIIRDSSVVPKAGMLVSIAAAEAGQLEITKIDYDKKIVGIISGANHLSPAIRMGAAEIEVADTFPVVILGSTYVLADARNGKIEKGDFLTSSPIPGYAMKAKNLKKAKGAIIGKAMTSLIEGKGYVLVLVNLQ